MECVGNPNRYPTLVRSICAVIILLSASLLISCNSATVSSNDTAEIDVLDKVRSLDILPRQPQQVNGVSAQYRLSAAARRFTTAPRSPTSPRRGRQPNRQRQRLSTSISRTRPSRPWPRSCWATFWARATRLMEPAVPQQPRRHLHRRHREGRTSRGAATAWASPSATTTTTAGPTSSSPTFAATSSSATTATAPSPT